MRTYVLNMIRGNQAHTVGVQEMPSFLYKNITLIKKRICCSSSPLYVTITQTAVNGALGGSQLLIAAQGAINSSLSYSHIQWTCVACMIVY
jgi:hypothetical protein